MSNQVEFKPGDIVYLNSGSPALTVQNVYDTQLTVTWFDSDQLRYITCDQVCFTKQKTYVDG